MNEEKPTVKKVKKYQTKKPLAAKRSIYKMLGVNDIGEFYATKFVGDPLPNVAKLDPLSKFDIAYLKVYWIYNQIPDGARVLDVGCGSGTLNLLKNKNIYLVGADISEKALGKALGVGYDEVVACDIHDIPYPDNYFDYVVSLDVLGHIENEIKDVYLEEWSRLLKKDGVALHGIESVDVDYDNLSEDEKKRILIDGHVGLESPRKIKKRFKRFYKDVTVENCMGPCYNWHDIQKYSDTENFIGKDFRNYLLTFNPEQIRAFNASMGLMRDILSRKKMLTDSGGFVFIKAKNKIGLTSIFSVYFWKNKIYDWRKNVISIKNIKLTAVAYFKKIGKNVRSFDELYFLLIFLACLGIHFYYSLIGWSHNLLDQYGFRQTQTAISTYYTIKDGFKLNYITPVLGAPWSIPMEFPLYQWIVASIVIFFKTSLDQTGRFVSLLFFYLSLIPLYSILGLWLKKKNHKLIILSLILLNPTYLFWSRTFMIESLALFLSILFGWMIIKFLENQNKPTYLVLGIVTGCLAALTKVTTFVALGPALAFIFGYIWYKKNKNRYSTEVLKKYFSYGLLLFGIPLIVTTGWNHYADGLKSLNPLANDYITSTALTNWNFGTFAQKIDFSVWKKIFENSFITDNVFGTWNILNYGIPAFFVIFLAFLFFSKAYRKEMTTAFIFFIIGPLIFTNLYFFHNYYFYANNFFISIILGLFIIAIFGISRKAKFAAGLVFFPLILFMLFGIYKKEFYLYQTGSNETLTEPAKVIKAATNPNDIILIYGQSWDSSLPYYAERKAIMDIGDLPLSDPKIKKSLDNLGSEKIAAMVIAEEKDEAFVTERTSILHLSDNPAFDDGKIKIYLRK